MITVTGATGNVGRPLVEALVAAGEQVNTVARGEAESGQYSTHFRADLSDPTSLKPALEGADALFLLTTDPGIDHPPVLDLARAAGVTRVVLMSSQRVVSRPEEGLAAFEAAVTESGLEWTVLRPAGFHSNALLWADAIRSTRTVAAPFADTALPTVDPLDLAAVAAKALTESGHTGMAYTLTGPAPISPKQQAAAIAEAIGEPVEFNELTRDEAFAAYSRFWPDEVVEGTLKVLGEPNETERTVTADIEQVLSRPATPFADWAKRNAAAFR